MESPAEVFGHSADQALLLESLLYSADIDAEDLCETDLLLHSVDQLSFSTLRDLVEEVDELQLASQCLAAYAETSVPVAKSLDALVAALKPEVHQPGKVFAARVIEAALSLDCHLTTDDRTDLQANAFYSGLMADCELRQKLVSTLDAGIEDYEYEFIWTILQLKEQDVDREVEEFRVRLCQQPAPLEKLTPQLSNEWVSQLKQALKYNE